MVVIQSTNSIGSLQMSFCFDLIVNTFQRNNSLFISIALKSAAITPKSSYTRIVYFKQCFIESKQYENINNGAYINSQFSNPYDVCK